MDHWLLVGRGYVVGQFGLTMLIKKLGRDSLIIFSVAAVVGVSAVLMATHSVVSMLKSAPDLVFEPFAQKVKGMRIN